MPILSARDLQLLGSGLPVLRTAKLPAGRQVQYRDTGSSSGEVVVLLHGLGSHSAGWRGVIADLQSAFRVVAWDAPGFGGSTPLDDDAPTAEAYARHLMAFADALGVKRFHLIGSSWGAVIAAAAAARYAERISTLTLLVPNACFGSAPEADRTAILAQLLSPDLVINAAPAAFAAMLTAPETPEAVLAHVRVLKDQVTEGGYAQAVRMMGNTDTVTVARTIAAPSLVLAGGSDQLAPAAAHAIPISQAISDSRLEILEGYGHLLKLEAPSRVATCISDFIDEMTKATT